MRLLAILVAISFCGGCRHCMEGVPCDEYGSRPIPHQEECDQAECKVSNDVTVRAPRSKVYVDVPATSAGTQAANANPQMASAQPQMVYAQQTPFQSPAAGQAMMAQTQQTISPPKTRLALGFDFIHIPIPVLRFYPVQGPSEVTTTTQYTPVSQPQYVPQYAVAAPQYAMAPQYTIAQPVQAVAPPQYIQVMPQPPAQTQMMRQAAPQAAPADCPPVSKETMEQIEREYQRAKALLDEVEKSRSQNAPNN